jgi:hypothetical protein
MNVRHGVYVLTKFEIERHFVLDNGGLFQRRSCQTQLNSRKAVYINHILDYHFKL